MDMNAPEDRQLYDLRAEAESLLAVGRIKKLGGKFLTKGLDPSWSPDAARIVFAQPVQGNVHAGAGLAILDLKTGQSTDLTSSGRAPAWSPGDGTLIAYVDGNTGDAEEVWLMESTGQKPRKIADGCFPSWSPDGKTLYYHSHHEKKLKAAPVDTGDVTAAKDFEDIAWCYSAVSPDGSQITYHEGSHLTILERQSGKCIPVWPLGSGVSMFPAWCPDGRWLAFGVSGPTSSRGLLVLDVAGGGVVQVAPSPALMPAWSGDGSKLAFDVRLPSGSEIWMIETEQLKDLEPLEHPGDKK
jgi:Tol biopolymer transport system component